MRVFFYPVREPSLRCWGWKLLCGPAYLIDGIVETLTFGLVGVGCRLAVSRNMARARIDAAKARKQELARVV